MRARLSIVAVAIGTVIAALAAGIVNRGGVVRIVELQALGYAYLKP